MPARVAGCARWPWLAVGARGALSVAPGEQLDELVMPSTGAKTQHPDAGTVALLDPQVHPIVVEHDVFTQRLLALLPVALAWGRSTGEGGIVE